MTLFRRLLYLGYYFRRMDWRLLGRFMQHTRQEHGMGRGRQAVAFVRDSLRYNISPLEWYQFGFVSQSQGEKATWAGTGTMYEFQLRANPPESRALLDDKLRFYRAYRQFFRHTVWALEELQADRSLAERVLSENDRLVFKDATGNCGKSVRIHASRDLDADTLVDWMKSEHFDLVEGFVEQHPDLQALSPSGVNTVRVFTLIDSQGEYRVLGCRLRISVDSPVDNLAAGNLAAPIDDATGKVSGPGVYSDITLEPEIAHPITGVSIKGFQVPYWQEILALVREASFLRPENRSIGWDVVVTPGGPGLIEGNHDWCKLVWQLPVRRGMKQVLNTDREAAKR